MSEASSEASLQRSAGTLLREARQAQGMHIAALAASIKVAQRKLESLEADRFDELPDATFTRALAQTVCRALKIDPAPVLALLPAPAGHRLEHVGEGLNQPFRERPGRHEPSDWSVLASPAVWGPLLLLVAAGVVYLMPTGWLASLQSTPAASAPAAPLPVEPSASAPAVVLMPAAPTPDAASPSLAEVTPQPAAASGAATASDAAPSAPAAAAPVTGALQLRAKSPSWIEVQDARSKVLMARVMQPGEIVALDGEAPLRLKVGNAGGTDVIFRGQPVDLTPSTRDNVARLELK